MEREMTPEPVPSTLEERLAFYERFARTLQSASRTRWRRWNARRILRHGSKGAKK
jgi:hypothetical protein